MKLSCPNGHYRELAYGVQTLRRKKKRHKDQLNKLLKKAGLSLQKTPHSGKKLSATTMAHPLQVEEEPSECKDVNSGIGGEVRNNQ